MKEEQSNQFKEELARLNTAQSQAVETIEGPVMVIAGPGTGKTQILAARIGYILENTDTNPENILCLTYTEAGTIAMRKRLFQFIGAAAYRVTISTFHAFCNNVIQDNLDVFGIRKLDPITELEEIDLYKELIDSFGKDHKLKRWTGDVYYETFRLKGLYRLMKTEDWTPELICEKADEYIAELPDRDEFKYKRGNSKKGIKIGDLKENAYKIEVDKMEILKAAAMEFPNYQQLMLKHKRYDYDDMILMVVNSFKSKPEMLLQYQERYHYFLVDEYQDTNGSQNEILDLLVSYWDKPNVFVVGDDDQSIYRFQGASVENITQFNDSYKEHVQVIMMTENYRSSQVILDNAGALIENNKGRLVNQIDGLEKKLKASNNDYAKLNIEPELIEYYNVAHETVDIANRIMGLKEQGVPLSDVAVIYRNHKQSEEIARYLSSQGVPVNIKRKTNILESVFVQNLLSILRYIDAETQLSYSREDLLFEILHYHFFDIEPIEIAHLAIELRNKKSAKSYWRDAIGAITTNHVATLFDNESNGSKEKIKKLSSDIEYWISEVKNTTLQVLLEKIVTRGGILAFVMNSPDKFWLMQELQSLFEFVKSESVKDPKINVSSFLRTIDKMNYNSISLEINKTFFTEEGVNMITAHSSKGLEFEHVFIIGCTSNDWDKPSRSFTYKLPDTIVTHLGQGDDVEESRRLFFVSLTRAKSHLYLSYPSANMNGKEMEGSRFVGELIEAGLTLQNKHLPDELMYEFNLSIMQEERLPNIQLLEREYLNKLLEKYALSVSHLNNYLKCPLTFYFSNLLRIPQAKNQYMAFGSAVHYALEFLFRKMQEEDQKFPPVSILIADFEWYMNRHQDSFTKEEYKIRLDYGRKILPEYYNKYVTIWNKVVSVERNFRGVEINGVPITGKLDKLEFDKNLVNVVDYKTGNYENAKKRFGPPTTSINDEEAKYEARLGGDYWRQAVFYKILVDADQRKDWKVDSTEFDFVEPNRKTGEYFKQKVVVTNEDMTIVEAQIKETYDKIMRLEFNKGCGDSNCKWCNFVKHHYVTDVGIKSEEEVDI